MTDPAEAKRHYDSLPDTDRPVRRTPPTTERDRLADDLNQWWMDVSHVEAVAVVDKAVEYGSNSMTELGHEIAKLSGRTVTDAQAIELACYFYIKGKLGRWSDAIMANKPVSDDTLGDIGVYVRMAQRVRSHGGWPGEPKDQAIKRHVVIGEGTTQFATTPAWRTCCSTVVGTNHIVGCFNSQKDANE